MSRVGLILSFFVFLTTITSVSAENVDISELVRQTNNITTDETMVLFGKKGRLTEYGLTRFDISSKIPLYFIASKDKDVDNHVTAAVERIEGVLGDIFSDINYLDYDVSKYNENSFARDTNISYGVIVSIGTSVGPSNGNISAQQGCSNVSVGPRTTNNYHTIDTEAGFYAKKTVKWINIGDGKCDVKEDQVVHEFAHSLGMYRHIDCYFTDGINRASSCADAPSWSPIAEDVLRAIYRNPGNTPYSEVR